MALKRKKLSRSRNWIPLSRSFRRLKRCWKERKLRLRQLRKEVATQIKNSESQMLNLKFQRGGIMAQTVIIPTPLRRFTDGIETVEVQGTTVGDIFNQLESRFPGIRARLCEDNGDLRRFINVYVDGEDIRFLDRLQTSVSERAEVSIVPAIAGG